MRATRRFLTLTVAGAVLGAASLAAVPSAVAAAAPAVAPAVAPTAVLATPTTQEPAAYLVADADSGAVIAAKNEHAPMLPASTIKVLTALSALARLPLDSTVPVSARAAAQPAMKINMTEGSVWKLDDALHALLIVSANDAAYAIAERTSGSVEQFAVDAQATAKRLGLTDTTFRDPAGLDDAGAYGGGSHTSAADLAITARNALAVPAIADAAKLVTYHFTDPNGAVRSLSNHNKGFLTTYPGAVGLKTGYTKAAGRTLVTAATRGARTCIATVMGTWDDTGWASSLLDQCFATAAGSAGTGAKLPPVRIVTADTRRAALGGLPTALGGPGASAAVPATVAKRTKAKATGTTAKSSKADKTAKSAPSTTKHPANTKSATEPAASASTVSTTTSGSSDSGGFGIGSVLNVRNIVIGTFVLLVALFFLRRRAVKRQRRRRIARQKAMAEARRRRMIDVVDHQRSPVRRVRVTEPRSRSRSRVSTGRGR